MLSSSKPPRPQSYMSSYNLQLNSNNITQFKQQTISILKQQSQKIRGLNSTILTKQQQLSIKNQQIIFLKQSISIIQTQNQNLIQDNNVLKMKLQKIVEEISIYNETVVKIIYQENQINKNKLRNVQNILAAKQNQLQEQNKYIQEQNNIIQTKNKNIQSLQQLIHQEKIKNLQFQNQISKHINNKHKLQTQINKLSTLLQNQQSRREKNDFQLNTINKQLNNLINKHNSMIKQYQNKLKQHQNKIKQINSNKVDKTQILVYENLVKSKQTQLSKLKRLQQVSSKKYQQTRKQYSQYKQKQARQNHKLKNKLDEYKTDLLTLKKSFELQKKPTQFISQKSQLLNKISLFFQTKKNQCYLLKQHNKQLNKTNIQMKSIIEKNIHLIHNLQLTNQVLNTRFRQLQSKLQRQYQSKLQTLILKIRTQEEALQRLKKNELQSITQYQKVHQLLNSTKKQSYQYKQVTENSLNKLNQQNQKLLLEMQQIYKICEENVDNKRTADKMKYVIHSLLIVIHYLQLKTIRSKQKQSNMYMPFIKAFYQRKNIKYDDYQQKDEDFKFQLTSAKKNNQSYINKTLNNPAKLKKLKSYVWAVISIFRINRFMTENVKSIKKQNIILNGINYKINKALTTRNKISNNNQLLQKQTQICMRNDNVEQAINQLINLTKNIFIWPERNYCKLNLNSNFNRIQ